MKFSGAIAFSFGKRPKGTNKIAINFSHFH